MCLTQDHNNFRAHCSPETMSDFSFFCLVLFRPDILAYFTRRGLLVACARQSAGHVAVVEIRMWRARLVVQDDDIRARSLP
jgi:hypothetical protein